MSSAPGPLEAAAYDRWFESTWGRYALQVESGALRRSLGDLPGALALEVGCGTGRFMDVLREAGATVIGVDVDGSMVALARERGHRAVVGDGRRLPFRSACFDLAVAVTVLEFVDGPQRLVAEMMRVTRPGGRAALAVLNPASPWGVRSARRRRRGPWASSRMLPAGRVAGWCRPYGVVRRHGALFVPGAFPGLARLGPVVEALGTLCPRRGAFQMVVVERR